MSDNWEKIEKFNPQRKLLESLVTLLQAAIVEEQSSIKDKLETMKKMGLITEVVDDNDIEPKP